MGTRDDRRRTAIVDAMADSIVLLLRERNAVGYNAKEREQIGNVYELQWNANKAACETFFPAERSILRPKAA